MFSSTKSNISITDVKKILKKHFPQEIVSDISELTDGMFNAVYSIMGSGALSDGVILKLGTTPDIQVLSGEKDIMRTEIAVYQMLQDTEVPLPKIYALCTDRTLVPCDYIIMQKLSGVTWKSVQFDLPKEETERLLVELGKMTAQINASNRSSFRLYQPQRGCLGFRPGGRLMPV